MPIGFRAHPGLLCVVATLLPLASFVLILLWRGLRLVVKPYRDAGLGGLYQALGGDREGRGQAYLATGAIGLAFICSLVGFVLFVSDQTGHGHAASSHAGEDRWEGQIEWARIGAKTDHKCEELHQP